MTDAEVYAKMVSGKSDYVLVSYTFYMGTKAGTDADVTATARETLRAAVDDLKLILMRALEHKIVLPQRHLIHAAMALFTAGSALGVPAVEVAKAIKEGASE